MPVILQAAGSSWLMKTEAGATAALKALADAMPVEQEYDEATGDYYYAPSERKYHGRLGLTVVKADQLRTKKKAERRVVALIGNGKPV
jgi:hypothetical protein